MAIRAVIPALEPDPTRLKAADLDPRMIAFLVVDRARAEAPANFADVAIDTADQATLNVHVLRTIIICSVEHLQRVALREWIKPDWQSARASEAASPMESRPGPSNEGIAERIQNLNLVADQLTSMLAAELSNAENAGPVLATPPPSVDGDLETVASPDSSNEGFAERQPNVDLITDKMASMLAVELSNAGHAASDVAQSPATEAMLTGEMRPEPEAREPSDRSGIRSGLRWSARFFKHGSTART